MALMIEVEKAICLTKWCPTQWHLIAQGGETYYVRFRYVDLTVHRDGPGGKCVFREPQRTVAEHGMTFSELKHALRGKFEFPDWVKQQRLADDPNPDEVHAV